MTVFFHSFLLGVMTTILLGVIRLVATTPRQIPQGEALLFFSVLGLVAVVALVGVQALHLLRR